MGTNAILGQPDRVRAGADFAKKSLVEQARIVIRAQAETLVPKVVEKLFGTPAGGKRVPEGQFLERVLRDWPDVKARQKLLDRMGPKHFAEMHHALSLYAQGKLERGEPFPDTWSQLPPLAPPAPEAPYAQELPPQETAPPALSPVPTPAPMPPQPGPMDFVEPAPAADPMQLQAPLGPLG
jgi:hypothetical protein